MPNNTMPPIQISAVAARSADVPTPILPVSPSSVPELNKSPMTPRAKTGRQGSPLKRRGGF